MKRGLLFSFLLCLFAGITMAQTRQVTGQVINQTSNEKLSAASGTDAKSVKFSENIMSLEEVYYPASSGNVTIDLILDERGSASSNVCSLV